jgi:IclR family acetate operon transcriptional repressor
LVQSVLRAAAILRAFGDAESLSLADLTARLNLPKPTVFRLAATLESAGLLERNPDGTFGLGASFVSTARLILGRGLPATARPHLERLFRAAGHSVNLAVLDQGELLYLDAIDSRDGLRLVAVVGDREPIHATAVGKAIAAALSQEQLDRVLAAHPLRSLTPQTITSRSQFDAELERVRERGYAIDDGECVAGARCVGAAIEDAHKVVGGISVTASASALHTDDLPRLGGLVAESARVIGESLGIEPRPAA